MAGGIVDGNMDQHETCAEHHAGSTEHGDGFMQRRHHRACHHGHKPQPRGPGCANAVGPAPQVNRQHHRHDRQQADQQADGEGGRMLADGIQADGHAPTRERQVRQHHDDDQRDQARGNHRATRAAGGFFRCRSQRCALSLVFCASMRVRASCQSESLHSRSS